MLAAKGSAAGTADGDSRLRLKSALTSEINDSVDTYRRCNPWFGGSRIELHVLKVSKNHMK